jgi:hypothetical protein
LHAVIKAEGSLQSGVLHDHISTVCDVEELLIVKAAQVNISDVLFVKPLNPFAIFPQAILDLALLGDKVRAEAMLLALPPIALIAPAIGPGIDTEAMFLVIFVLSFVFPSIVPHIEAEALHVVVDPLALILSPIEP